MVVDTAASRVDTPNEADFVNGQVVLEEPSRLELASAEGLGGKWTLYFNVRC